MSGSLAIQSILEELRCMDGELFKTEVAQRLFLWLKTQASESLETLFNEKSLAEYTRALDKYKTWPSAVSDEELAALEHRAGGKEELRQVWTSVSAQWVRLTRKSEGSKASVKIRTPDPLDVLKSFFVNLVSKSWCARGELWSMDPVKQDFVFREAFRQAVSESVHVLEDARAKEYEQNEKVLESLKAEETLAEVLAEKRSEEARAEALARAKEAQDKAIADARAEEARAEEARAEARAEEAKAAASAKEAKAAALAEAKAAAEAAREHEIAQSTQAHAENDSGKGASKQMDMEKDEDDEIGPDDSVSHFYKANSVIHTPAPVLTQTRRTLDAGTVVYPTSTRRAVQPLKIQLQAPVTTTPSGDS